MPVVLLILRISQLRRTGWKMAQILREIVVRKEICPSRAYLLGIDGSGSRTAPGEYVVAPL
jgi:hypothetical protein